MAYVTYEGLFTFVLMLCAVVTLIFKIVEFILRKK